MNWYAVHAIMYMECLEGEQDSYDIYENIFLIHAADFDEAEAKGIRRAKEDESSGSSEDGQTWNNRPARTVFAGLRKVLCMNGEEQPGDGTELSYSLLTVLTKEDVRKLAADEPVDVTYQDSKPYDFTLSEDERKRHTKDADSLAQYIKDTYYQVQFEEVDGNTTFFYGDDHKMPFATLLTKDTHDTVSALNRPGIYRLDIGARKASFQRYFDKDLLIEALAPSEEELNDEQELSDTPATDANSEALSNANYDYTALDTLMPHPLYGKRHWVCVLNPGEETFEMARILLDEAYLLAVYRYNNRVAHQRKIEANNAEVGNAHAGITED
jgi:hypothetical protein